MHATYIIVGLVVALLGTVGFMTKDTLPAIGQQAEVVTKAAVTLYKSPTCGCCGAYGTYLRQEGYGVTVEERPDMTAVKTEHGIPYELESCHTMVIDGYVVEGHVPEAAIAKLLAERPAIKGIGMAGMPSGSPGMPGPKADLMVYTINEDGTKGELFVQL